jgi:hypothetical protein
MDTGGIGAIFLSVLSPAEEGIRFRQDSATVQHLLMEEQIVLDQILILRLAIFWNALLVYKMNQNALKIEIIKKEI